MSDPTTSTVAPIPSDIDGGRGLGPRGLVILVSGFLTVLLAAVISLLPAPYAIYSPGPVTNVLGSVEGRALISISGHQTYPTSGTLDMTTVHVVGGPGSHLSLLQVAHGWLSRSQAVLPQDQVFPPGQSVADVEKQDAEEMTDSQKQSTAAGLREAGITVPEKIQVAQVAPDVPAASVVKVGDVITGIDGSPTADSAALRAAITSKPVGSRLTVQVLREGRRQELTTRTTESGGTTVLGVSLTASYTFPVDVSFGTRDVGGPSAGMMFALGIYDMLTPGALTGGAKIAGTGTIDGAGTVGPIGGIQQKLVGARDAGAVWFIAPASNCDEVVGNVPDGLHVVKSSSLHDSRLAVEAIAAGRGASLPTCTR